VRAAQRGSADAVEALVRIGARQPFGVFTAFVPAAQAERDRLSRHRDRGVIVPGDAGPAGGARPVAAAGVQVRPPPGPFEYRSTVPGAS
jgi:hypothetical protein